MNRREFVCSVGAFTAASQFPIPLKAIKTSFTLLKGLPFTITQIEEVSKNEYLMTAVHETPSYDYDHIMGIITARFTISSEAAEALLPGQVIHIKDEFLGEQS